jgi:hypothetical protein
MGFVEGLRQYWMKTMLVPSLRINAFLQMGLIGSNITLYKKGVSMYKGNLQKGEKVLQNTENQPLVLRLINYR